MKNKNWYLTVLAIISVPFILYFTLYLGFFVPIIQYIDYHTLHGVDFDVYMRAVTNFCYSPENLYVNPPEIGTLWYIYPPASIYFFVPFYYLPEPINYFIYKATLLIVYFLSIYFILKTIGFDNKIVKDNKIKFFLILIALSSLFKELTFMNANALVLFFSVLGFFLYCRNKAFSGILSVTYAFYLKLYSIFLFPFFVIGASYKKRMIFFLIALILFPLLLIFKFPLDMYFYYFLNYMPGFSAHPQASNPMNNSLMCMIQHLFMPSETFAAWDHIYLTDALRIINIIVALAGLICLMLYYYFNKQSFAVNKIIKLFVFSSLLALSLMVSITAWEFAYVMAMPVMLLTLYLAYNSSNLTKIAVIVMFVVYFIPKPPSAMILELNNYFPFILQFLFYFKYLFITGICIFLNYYLIKKQKINIMSYDVNSLGEYTNL